MSSTCTVVGCEDPLLIKSVLAASGKGFGKKDSREPSGPINKTYGKAAQSPILDVIDQEGAMAAFFSSREEWHPVFRSLAGTSLPSATAEFLRMSDEFEFVFSEESNPWKRNMNPIPQEESDREIISKFLDSMHQSLLDIPVDETTAGDDDNDVQFIEEGRRMLAISRFFVIRQNFDIDKSIERYDELFNTCWSELIELTQTDQSHTGSLILLPDYDLSDLRRFTDINLARPLHWLGLHKNFEVVSLKRGSPAIRLLYKLNDIPAGEYTEEDGFAGVD